MKPLLFVTGLALASCRPPTPPTPPSAPTEPTSSMPADPKPAPNAAATEIPSDAELRQKLTREQYHVTRENGTEPAFRNPYWDNHEPGLYVDIISGEPLFASTHKFDSGTGWPSFFQPVDPKSIVEKHDNSYGMLRVEVRSRKSDAHLGHLFPDGPKPTGQRYCINSASLKFIPATKLKEEGYEALLPLFSDPKP